MKSTDELIDSAGELADRGLSKGEIADELNVSRETASWLVEQSGEGSVESTEAASPTDVHVDWSAIGRDSKRLTHVGIAMADLLADEGDEVDLTVGIGKSGGPLATVISRELDTDLSVYLPSKYQWNDEGESGSGSFSRNFASIRDRQCYVVDDNIDTGQTMTETIQHIRDRGGDVDAAVVLTDKHGEDEILGVPVYSMVEIVQMQD
ncbi:transcriptional regulator GfcR [Halapricum hydrolyticum]|uniref:Transcriptional regulator GfcR n=1 Tax=Halapricum hydrolyticum TaxID=2979991 RepID=A0AAE3LHP6_9EURY|nr:transcriptional regulator GfcR [Halapricum hydrolyticum]MCU4716977.1 orotate phosphoribosyltransferase-like protein [Halapricum hydrolyticum]MCU4725418.1 orotate phosphoribosyltransferase-like protein [Halapricum hydrolyticum]